MIFSGDRAPAVPAGAWPHVIGLLPTRNRHALAHRAAHQFFAQAYPGALTLYVYDDSPTPWVPCAALAAHDLVVEHLPPIRLPTKRNQMMRRAIAQDPDAIYVVWDDDDYHGPQRLARQVAALRATPTAEGVVFCPFLSFDEATGVTTRLGKGALHGLPVRVFTDAVLAFRRALWERWPWDEAVDPHACWRWMAAPTSMIIDLPAEHDYLVIRHATNHTAGMLPRQYHPVLGTPHVDDAWGAVTWTQLRAALDTGRPSPDQRRCGGSKTAR